jgi:methionine sulfoxide reductase heme-binding subunit
VKIVKSKRYTPFQILVHLAGWLPLALLVFDFFRNNLTANPIQAIQQRTGVYAINFLLLSLACTPLASILGWKEPLLRRKALGNYGFFYAALHVVNFFVLDYALDLWAIWRDVGTKFYIIIGAIAFVLLLPLAITSFNYWMKRLGRNWKRLHRLAYLISPLVVAHFFMAKKGDLLTLSGDIFQPLLYGVLTLLLLLLRLGPIKRPLIALRHRIQKSQTEK